LRAAIGSCWATTAVAAMETTATAVAANKFKNFIKDPLMDGA